jgi:hypothetical protein
MYGKFSNRGYTQEGKEKPTSTEDLQDLILHQKNFIHLNNIQNLISGMPKMISDILRNGSSTAYIDTCEKFAIFRIFSVDFRSCQCFFRFQIKK